MVVQTEQEPHTTGELIRFWRTRRGLSQLDLSLDAHVSTKHLSFVETGRSSPSRQLLVHLAQHLDLPIAERNRLLLAGGFAPLIATALLASGGSSAVALYITGLGLVSVIATLFARETYKNDIHEDDEQERELVRERRFDRERFRDRETAETR